MHTLEGHTHGVKSLSFSPDSSTLVSGGYRSIRLWNPSEGKLLKKVDNAHTTSISAITHSPNGSLVASSSYDSAIKTFDAKTMKLKFAIDDTHSNAVTDVSFTPSGPFLLSASNDSTVKVTKIALLEDYEKRFPVLLAYLHFSEKVNTSSGSEVRKFEMARSAYATKFAGGVLQCGLIGGGPKGVLGVILSYV